MPYVGQTYRIPCNRGGWFPNPNADIVPPESMEEAININLHRGGRETRGGTMRVNGTPISGSPRITGIFQFRKKNGNAFIVTGTSDGKIQKDFSTVLKTGLATNAVFTFEVFKDTLYICNGVNIPQTWDGIAGSTSDLALAKRPSDWTGTNHPKRMVKHGRGVSEALWAFGVASQPQRLYASATGTDDFSDSNVTTINIETGDGFGVIGMEEFGDRLIPMGKRRAYIVDDESPTRANWGYEAAQWEGGLGAMRLLAKTPNDLIAMSEEGEIFSVVTTQTVGDYRAASIARPAFIHSWIEEHLDISKIDDFHMIYDPVLRAVKIFVIRKPLSRVDTALVFFVDRPPEEAWTQHRYFKLDFASSSSLVRGGSGTWKVYLGGHTGHAYELESDIATDDGDHYYSGFLTIDNPFDNPRVAKRYDRGWLIIKPQGKEEININVFVDGVATSGGFGVSDEFGNEIVDEDGNFVLGGTTARWVIRPQQARHLINESHAIGMIGTRIQSEVYNNSLSERMFVSQVLYDHIPVGPARISSVSAPANVNIIPKAGSVTMAGEPPTLS